MSWLSPGPHYGYRITQIDEHPWNTLITMKEILKLDPGSLVFVGPDAELHERYWKGSAHGLFDTGKKPVFQIDVTPIHPHVVETKPRTPFKPYPL
ncbi:MAG: hypothetical protein V4507_08955 [Verrucomicrobiota bacterium]